MAIAALSEPLDAGASLRDETRRPLLCIATSIHADYDARVFRHARAVAEMGYEVDLVCPWGEPPVPLPRGLRIVPFRRVTSRVQRSLAHARMMRLLLRRPYALFHFHDFDSLPLFATLKLALRRPVVYDCHENYDQELLARAHRVPMWARRILAGAVREGERALARAIGNVVVVVPRQVETFAGRARRTVMVQNFAELDLERGRLDDYDQRPDACVAIGSQYVDNGALFLADVARAVLSRRPHVRFYVADRYGADHKLREQVVAAMRSAGIENNLSFLPHVPAPEIMKHVNRGTIALSLDMPVPRRAGALPIKLFEYMAGGLPIVASALPNARQVIEAAQCGVLAEPANAASFADAVCSLVDDRRRAKEMGFRGLAMFRARYNWQAEMAKVRALYEELLGSPSPGNLE